MTTATKTYRRSTPAMGSNVHAEFVNDWVVEEASTLAHQADVLASWRLARREERSAAFALGVAVYAGGGLALLPVVIALVNAVVR